MSSIDKSKEIEKALGEPFALDFTEYTRKIRNNLFFVSVVAIVIVVGKISINTSDSTLLGLKFNGINNEFVIQVLLILNVYFLIHFIWLSIENFQEWILRTTGTRHSFITSTAWEAEGKDYPSDPRQSTLYRWWIENSGNIKTDEEALNKCTKLCTKITNDIKNSIDIKSDLSTIKSSIETLTNELINTGNIFNSYKEIINQERIKISLNRFDTWFERTLRMQNLRWLIIEFLMPTLLGIYSIFLLGIKIYY